MILDSSAVIASLRREPECDAFDALVQSAAHVRVAAPTVLEVALVAGPDRAAEVDEYVAACAAEIVAFDEQLLALARRAHHRYGRGSGHPAALNVGDCMSYALADASGESLLFKGDDFSHTDVTPAYRPA